MSRVVAALLILGLLGSRPGLAKVIPIDTNKSQIEWEGKKRFSVDGHIGTVRLKSGNINLDHRNYLMGGTIIIDMESIVGLDLSGAYKTKLEEHLKSDDFFDVKNNPEASFKILTVQAPVGNRYMVTGNLTIRGITHSETFAVNVEKKGPLWTATGVIEFDRTKYGVQYNAESSRLKKVVSVPKDKIISNTISLKLQLQTNKI